MLTTVTSRAILAFYASSASAWAIGRETTETHPKLSWKRCTGTGGSNCTTVNGEIVLDANWRWLHETSGFLNCYDGNKWNAWPCPDNAACTKNCAIEGADYKGTYGISTSGDSVLLKFVTKDQFFSNVGSRTYLMKDASNYEMFNLIGKEFTFDVDLSQLPCGVNGALYFVSMPQKGQGTSGAKYGTGYCDAQCARDLKFVGGQANAEGWRPSLTAPSTGVGKKGACCAEMDVWEANSMATALTPHSCQPEGNSICVDEECGGMYSPDRYAGTCDADGCDFNPYRVGARDFFGRGKTVDTTKKMTVVTQFIGSGSTLTEIKRFYVQGGIVYENPEPTISGISGNSITQDWCNTQKEIFNEKTYPFNEWGGMESMGRALAQGMVLVMRISDDHYSNMLWLDSTYPTDSDPETPGASRGACDITSGNPTDVESTSTSAQVVFSNIKFGPIGSTFPQPS